MVAATFPNTFDSKDRRTARTRSSKIFQPFRAIGYVTADVPICVQVRGQAHAITTSVGNAFHIYDGEKLSLLFTGPQSAEPVSAVAVFKDRVFAATGSHISVAERGKEVARYVSDSDATIFSLVVFGNLLLALCKDNVVRIWDHTIGELYNELTFPESFRVTCAMHPSTYLNKVLFGSQQGSMQLWNLRTLRLLYEFPSLGSPITFLTQAPSVDVVAIGLMDGSIILRNIRVDVEVMRLLQEGKVTAIAFRTDEKPHMATASISGDIAIWNLDKQQLIHIAKGAHEGPIHSLYYYAGQPILITAGADNAIKQWVFDSAEGNPRLLRSRGGHHEPPSRIRYHPFEHSSIISAGNDQALRLFSVTRDSNSLEISLRDQKAKRHLDDARIPVVTQFDASEGIESKSVNIITAHVKDYQARTCSFGGKPITKRTYTSTDNSLIKAVAVSACGNFGFVGSTLGRVDRYNLQSGLLRKTYSNQHGGHTKAVAGIASDRVNRIVVTASLDCTLKFWSFQSGALLQTVSLPAPVGSIVLDRESGLLAASSDDFILRVVDIQTMRIVREFSGHRSHITDMCFSPDGRLLVSSSVDATIRTWDLPTGYMVDLFRVNSVPRSLSFSPTGDFLATAHADHIGIFLWVNRMQFVNVPFRNLSDEDLVELELPKMANDETDVQDGDAEVPTESWESELPPGEVVDDSLIMLSGLPKIRWQNLLSLEAIKKRNKSVEAPKAERAPFFLPSLREMEQTFGATASEKQADGQSSRIIRLPGADVEPEFVRLLREGSMENDYSAVMTHIQTLSPSAVDLTLRTMAFSTSTDNSEVLSLFLDALAWQLEKRRDFEAVEYCLNALLKIHSDSLMEPGVQERIQTLVKRHAEAWEVLEKMFHYGLCLLDFIRL
ncbi:hypothetical protein SpCBS45565_g07059 [Spizellomyces sp. 'palustris']|nr:hypothetical protein SpCBS45565_g07059 [Spizellomyces sp. 'palustris']